MKILLASECYTYQTNGVSRVVKSLARGLRSIGEDVRVLAPANGLKSFRDGDDYYIKSVPALYYKGERFSFSLRDPLILELIKWDPDIIHLHSSIAGGIGSIPGRGTKVLNAIWHSQKRKRKRNADTVRLYEVMVSSCCTY